MTKSWAGPLVVGVIVVGIGGFLFLNLEGPKPANAPAANPPAVGQAAPAPAATPGAANDPVVTNAAPIREYPIGDEVEQNHIRVAAVWLPAVTMDNMPSDPSMHPIHIEADVKALANNPNGFAKDEKVDYLKVAYTLIPAAGGPPVAAGDLTPMMARDGFHYGATIAMPAPGSYKLVYAIQPPSAGGLGRHSDPATGVAPWWEPFQASFDWDVDAHDASAVSLR